MDTKQVKTEIAQFFDYFRNTSAYFKRQLAPDAHSPANHELLAAKMACCALIDALSGAQVSGERGVGKRLKALIKEFCPRDYWDCVSMPQILYALEARKDSQSQKLYDYAQRHLAGQHEYAIESDPPGKDLVDQFSKHDKLIARYTHVALFCKYRNCLVHEMRQPGYGYEFKYDKEPCYRGQTEIGTGRRTFQLTYPVKFFFALCDECITNLEQFFLTRNTNPFDRYESRFGDAW